MSADDVAKVTGKTHLADGSGVTHLPGQVDRTAWVVLTNALTKACKLWPRWKGMLMKKCSSRHKQFEGVENREGKERKGSSI